MNETVVQCQGIQKRFPLGPGEWREALAGVDLEVRRGEIFGLLGPNGAGKTTLLKILLGLLKPDAGTCDFWGQDGRERKIRARIGYVPEGPFFHRFATARQILNYHWRLLGHSLRDAPPELARVEKRVGLEGALDQTISGFSKGMRQRLALAQALLGDPDLLVLDEPTGGLDPVATVAFGRLLERLRDEGKAVLLCTHLLSQAEQVCDRVAVIHRGKLVLEGNMSDLRTHRGLFSIRISELPEAARSDVEAVIVACGGVVESWEPVADSLETLLLRSMGEGRGREA